MIDRNSKSEDDTRRHIEESLASGRITRFEADIIASFFATPPSPEWPASGLQRRMQTSGKRGPVGAANPSNDSDRKPKA
jgi:hypothetical protein